MIRLTILALTVSLPLLRPPHRHRRNVSAAVPAVRYDAPRSGEALAGDLASQLSRRVRTGHWGVIVVSLTRGDTLYQVNADQPLQPASTMKLFTSALALERFGPDYQFSTDVLRDGTVDSGGTLHGNLILRGDGDPSLSNRFLRGEPDAPMQLLARYVKAAGIKRIDGDIIGDATAFVDQPVPLGWKPRWLTAGYAPRISALSLNDNLAWVATSPGVSSHAAIVGLVPASSAIPITNTVTTVDGSFGSHVIVTARSDGGVNARGWIGSRAPTRTVELVIEDPALYTTGALRDALASQGVAITGGARLGQTTAGAITVASLPSPPLARIIAAMNRESINCYAELLFRDAVRGPQHTEA